jgi:hypothetical protein
MGQNYLMMGVGGPVMVVMVAVAAGHERMVRGGGVGGAIFCHV